jgi:hypothetical protein
MLGAATPGATAGKRTSWLAKAREVKALEGNGKKLVVPVIPSHKRGFDKDMLVGNNQEVRVPKIAKLVEGDIAPRNSKEIPFLLSTKRASNT